LKTKQLASWGEERKLKALLMAKGIGLSKKNRWEVGLGRRASSSHICRKNPEPSGGAGAETVGAHRLQVPHRPGESGRSHRRSVEAVGNRWDAGFGGKDVLWLCEGNDLNRCRLLIMRDTKDKRGLSHTSPIAHKGEASLEEVKGISVRKWGELQNLSTSGANQESQP